MSLVRSRHRRARPPRPTARQRQGRYRQPLGDTHYEGASRLTRTRSAGDSPAEGRARPLVARAAGRRETNLPKACRQSPSWKGERVTRP